MGPGKINNTGYNPQFDNDPSIRSQGVGDIVFNVNKKEKKVTKQDIKKMARNLAKVAYSMGETNDEDEYAEMMEEDLTEALNKVKRRREEKGKKN